MWARSTLLASPRMALPCSLRLLNTIRLAAGISADRILPVSSILVDSCLIHADLDPTHRFVRNEGCMVSESGLRNHVPNAIAKISMNRKSLTNGFVKLHIRYPIDSPGILHSLELCYDPRPWRHEETNGRVSMEVASYLCSTSGYQANGLSNGIDPRGKSNQFRNVTSR